jgi:hypothetical protein
VAAPREIADPGVTNTHSRLDSSAGELWDDGKHVPT